MSLIQSVAIHELIHTVRADRPGDDALPDFLVNDELDLDALPDMLYLSDGSTAVVTTASGATVAGEVVPSNRQVVLSPVMVSGWCYGRLADPGAGYRLSRVVRSDGKEMPAGVNFWQTDRVFAEGSAAYRHEDRLQFLDYDAVGMSYTLYYVVDDQVPPSVESVSAVEPNPRDTAVSSVDVTFSEEIDLSTFDYQDLTLTCNGGADLIDAAVTVAHVEGATYRIGNLDAVTGADGNYTLTVNAAGIRDYGENAGANSASTSWAKAANAPVVVSVGPVAPDPRNAAVSEVLVVFSRPVQASTFDAGDLVLLRDGAPLGTAGLNFTPVTESTFTVGGLAALTGAEGRYALTVNATGVADTLGNPGIGSLSDSWVMDATGPSVTGVEQVATNPRNIVVFGLDVTFSEPIDPATFDWRDVTLRRNGGANLVTSEVEVARVNDLTYRVSNINWVCGQHGGYVLTVHGQGIADPAGNLGGNAASSIWVMDATRPNAPTELAVVPDNGISAADGLTNTGEVTFTGLVDEPGAEVTLFDLIGMVDLGRVAAVQDGEGYRFSQALSLSPGGHTIRAGHRRGEQRLRGKPLRCVCGYGAAARDRHLERPAGPAQHARRVVRRDFLRADRPRHLHARRLDPDPRRPDGGSARDRRRGGRGRQRRQVPHHRLGRRPGGRRQLPADRQRNGHPRPGRKLRRGCARRSLDDRPERAASR